jgi:hypothetical protein
LPAFFRSEGAAQDVSKPRGDIDNPTKSPSAQNWETKNAGKMPALPRIVVAAKKKGHANVPSNAIQVVSQASPRTHAILASHFLA